MRTISPTLEELDSMRRRFYKHVCNIPTPAGCLEWTGDTTLDYGRLECANTGKRRMFLAHRVSLLLAGVDVPSGALVLHSCDNPKCVNPAHLRAGTSSDNMRDRASRSKPVWMMGERHWRARMDAETVAEIRELRSLGLTQREIAAVVGFSQSDIHMILHGRRWSHL